MMLIVLLLLCMSLNVMADNTKNKPHEPILIQTQIFTPDKVLDSSLKADNQTDGAIGLLSTIYEPGTVRINDIL